LPLIFFQNAILSAPTFALLDGNVRTKSRFSDSQKCRGGNMCDATGYSTHSVDCRQLAYVHWFANARQRTQRHWTSAVISCCSLQHWRRKLSACIVCQLILHRKAFLLILQYILFNNNFVILNRYFLYYWNYCATVSMGHILGLDVCFLFISSVLGCWKTIFGLNFAEARVTCVPVFRVMVKVTQSSA